MNNNYINSDTLIQYMDNELSLEDKTNIENQLKHDAIMQQELENLTLAKSAIKTYGLKKHVSTIHAEMMNEMVVEKTSSSQQGIVRKIVRISMKVAAAIFIVMLGVGVYQYATITPDKVFASNYTPYTLSVNRGTVEKDMIEKSFKEKNYTGITTQFETLTDASTKGSFLAAIAYMETNNYKKAIAAFNNVLSKNTLEKTSILNDDAQYFLAMSYLKNNEVKLAMPIFEMINNNTNHLYNDKVTSAFMRKLKIINWKY
jgi:tetratricopeptide (TPR) repeat protein